MPNSRYDPDDPRYWEPDSDEPEDPHYPGESADDYWDYELNGDNEDDESEFDCGFVLGYGCQLAGSEDCDWECPYSAELIKHPDYPNVSFSPIPPFPVVALSELRQHLSDTSQP